MSPFDLNVDDIDERTARVLLTVISPPGTAAVMGGWVAARGALDTLRLALGSGPVDMHEAWEVDDWRATIRARLAAPAVTSAFFAALAPDTRVLIPSDPHWPTGLEDLGHWAPLALWAEGKTGLLPKARAERVAVVGRQAATDYGRVMARQLAQGLTDRGLQVVSGGAHGIDTEAHRGAFVAGGSAIVVQAGSLDHPFPPSNTELFHRIRDNGGVLLTETPPGILTSRASAQARHRITAAISGAMVGIEVRDRSKTPDACDEALALGRPVGAVPGPVTSNASTGSHTLIREYGATLVTHAADVVGLLHRDPRDEAHPEPPTPSQCPSPPHNPAL